MATTVTYKGATLTTVTNGTKYLLTAGKYMEDNVTITDESSGGSAIVVTEETDECGGIIKYINAVDLSNDTVSPAVLLEGYTAHDYQGNPIEGEYAGPTLQSKTVSPSTSSQTVRPDSNYTGLSSVTVNAIPSGTAGTPSASKGTVSNHSITVTPSVTNTTGYITGGTKNGTGVTVTASELASGNKSITQNGTNIDVVGYSTVSVNVSGGSTPSLQTKTATPTESAQTVTPDTGYDGLSSVSVEAISSTYVGSGITRRTASDLTNPTGTPSILVPAGYYEEGVGKSVPVGTEGTPVATKGTVSNHSVSVTPSVENSEGYIYGDNPTGTPVTVTAAELVSGTLNITSSGTKDVTNYASASVSAGSATAPSTISGTSATVSTGTNTLTLTKTVSVTPTVTAGYMTNGTAGNSSVSLTASVTTKAAATITPGTTEQTIAAGTYLTGTQTISGDADLVGSNIISTANIFGVQGTVVIQNVYTGSSAPSSSTGSDGDIYIQT